MRWPVVLGWNVPLIHLMATSAHPAASTITTRIVIYALTVNSLAFVQANPTTTEYYYDYSDTSSLTEGASTAAATNEATTAVSTTAQSGNTAQTGQVTSTDADATSSTAATGGEESGSQSTVSAQDQSTVPTQTDSTVSAEPDSSSTVTGSESNTREVTQSTGGTAESSGYTADSTDVSGSTELTVDSSTAASGGQQGEVTSAGQTLNRAADVTSTEYYYSDYSSQGEEGATTQAGNNENTEGNGNSNNNNDNGQSSAAPDTADTTEYAYDYDYSTDTGTGATGAPESDNGVTEYEYYGYDSYGNRQAGNMQPQVYDTYEDGCNQLYPKMCTDNSRCIRQIWICDTYIDCDDGSDEADCPAVSTTSTSTSTSTTQATTTTTGITNVSSSTKIILGVIAAQLGITVLGLAVYLLIAQPWNPPPTEAVEPKISMVSMPPPVS